MRFILFFFILIASFTISCNAVSKGKIIKKQECEQSGALGTGKQQYLANTSNNEKITFTLKIIRTNHHYTDDAIKEKVINETYTLNPGEEKKLNCEVHFFEKNNIQRWMGYEYEIVGAVVEKL